jgi:hypothetical protein
VRQPFAQQHLVLGDDHTHGSSTPTRAAAARRHDLDGAFEGSDPVVQTTQARTDSDACITDAVVLHDDRQAVLAEGDAHPQGRSARVLDGVGEQLRDHEVRRVRRRRRHTGLVDVGTQQSRHLRAIDEFLDRGHQPLSRSGAPA